MTHAFGRSWTLGVEEELMLVDAATFALAPGVTAILPERSERVKTELFECLVEVTTEICDDAGQVLEQLRALRADVSRRAAERGLALAAAGAHPFSRGQGQPIVNEPRYRKLLDELGAELARQLVCGLHVHVGMPDPETCLRALEGVLPRLPLLLSLSANSPYLEGEETGARSARAGRLAELPWAEAPPPLNSWADWERAVAGRDWTRVWWDVRPHPGLGTLEVRIADQQTSVRRSAGFAALVQALAVTAAEGGGAPYDRDAYVRRRAQAAHHPPDPAELRRLAALVEPAARRLGGWELAEELLSSEPECGQQLAVGRAQGLVAVAADLVARSAL